LRYSLQQELGVSRPATIRVLDDSFSPAGEAFDLYEPLRRQVENFGWRAELTALDDLMKWMQSHSQPTRDQVIIVTTNRLPDAATTALINFVERGGTLVTLMGQVPFPQRFDIASIEAPDEQAKWRLACKIAQEKLSLADTPAKYLLTSTTSAAEARYVALVSAYEKQKPLGEIAALFDYRGAKKGALIAVSASLTLRPAKRNLTYHQQATGILKTALVFLLEGGAHFFVYEFRDQEVATNAKCYGLVEEDFALKDAAQALRWLERQIGNGIVVRNKNYFTDGAMLELENLSGQRFVVTWGQEAATRFKTEYMNWGRYTPQTYHKISAEKLLTGLEQKQAGILDNFIVWQQEK
jgi:hypothetical protein